ncbi:MAG: hypothetical protein AB7F40_07500 [Victivallaceae bacterium]|nr:hypothetical protein [Victivallaceae bacterium]
MHKFLLTAAAIFGAMLAFGEESPVADLVRHVPAGTNVILYVNAGRLQGTKFLQQMRDENTKFNNMVDGIQYHEEQLGIKGQAVKSIMLCRDTSKATASFYLLNTVVPENKFEEVFVADYAFFVESKRDSVMFDRSEIPYFELVRKRTPEIKYGAVYLGRNKDTGNYVVTVVPISYLQDTLEALQSPPISGEVATVAGHSMDPNAIAWMVASLKTKGDAFSTWDKSLNGLVFAELTFDLVGEQEDIKIEARFFSDSTRTGNAARFGGVLRAKKEQWLDSMFDRSNEALREKLDKCINISIYDGRVVMTVDIPAKLYAQLCDIYPTLALDMLNTVCEVFQLVEPEMVDNGGNPMGQLSPEEKAAVAKIASLSDDGVFEFAVASLVARASGMSEADIDNSVINGSPEDFTSQIKDKYPEVLEAMRSKALPQKTEIVSQFRAAAATIGL